MAGVSQRHSILSRAPRLAIRRQGGWSEVPPVRRHQRDDGCRKDGLHSIPGDAVVVETVWTVCDSADGETRSGRTVAREAVQGSSYDALAAAHSRALARLSSDIAAAIRAEAGRHAVR